MCDLPTLPFNVTDIAKVCHEANRAFCETQGDMSQPQWEHAPGWQQKSAVAGVKHRIEYPMSTPSDSHRSWLAQKEADGWVYGEKKDPDAKTHPCMVPYDQLPAFQKAKDSLFISVVDSLKHLMFADDASQSASSGA